jgi:hypothetical protein
MTQKKAPRGPAVARRKTAAKPEELPEVTAVARVAPHAMIGPIRLTDAAFGLEPFHARTPESNYGIGMLLQFSPGADSNRVRIRYQFRSPVPHQGEPQEIVYVVATYLTEYKIAPKANLDAQSVEHFCRVNGVFNTWPYWREFVQATLQRLSLPPLTLPLLVLPKAVEMARKAGPIEE